MIAISVIPLDLFVVRDTLWVFSLQTSISVDFGTRYSFVYHYRLHMSGLESY